LVSTVNGCFCLSKEFVKNSYKPLVVGFATSDVAEKDRLSKCSFAESISVSRGVPLFMCKLGGSACKYYGLRAKFRLRFDIFYVVSLCEKLDGLPDFER